MAYEAEVRALRALFYYYIMDMYGRVPIVTSYEQPQDEVVQSERSEVFRFIVNELQEVAELLPNERSNKMGNYYGRITTPVANFLLAKLLLMPRYIVMIIGLMAFHGTVKRYFFTVDGEKLNAWQTCIKYCNKLAEVGYRLEDVIAIISLCITRTPTKTYSPFRWIRTSMLRSSGISSDHDTTTMAVRWVAHRKMVPVPISQQS